MEYCLGIQHFTAPGVKGKLELLEALTEEQFIEFRNSMIQIEDNINIKRLFQFVKLNQEDLHNHITTSFHRFIELAKSGRYVSPDYSDPAFLDTNRLFLNYLSSMRTFVDHSQTFLSRKFGPDSGELRSYKEFTQKLYDTTFAYRFLYKLRNYAQHVGMPIDDFRFFVKKDFSKKMNHARLTVGFTKSVLLTKYTEWGTVKGDLKQMPDQFDAFPLVAEMTRKIEDVKRKVELIHRNELSKAASFIHNLVKHLDRNNGHLFVAVFETPANTLQDITINTILIPFESIDYIQNNFEEK